MARPRKTETSVNITPNAASAAPARRKTAAPRTRATAKPGAMLTQPASEEVATPVISAVSEDAGTEYVPSHEEIAALAYTYWEKRGYADGNPEHDWLRAEAELRQRSLATA
jgi:hypothetical protein